MRADIKAWPTERAVLAALCGGDPEIHICAHTTALHRWIAAGAHNGGQDIQGDALWRGG
jgi:hypothetical protein